MNMDRTPVDCTCMNELSVNVGKDRYNAGTLEVRNRIGSVDIIKGKGSTF